MNERHAESRSSRKEKVTGIAMALLALAVLIQMSAAAVYTHSDRQRLRTSIDNQEAALVETRKVREQLNAITGKTFKLAQEGNQKAASIIQQMQAAGVNLSAGQE